MTKRKGGRVPRKISLFDQFIQTTTAYLLKVVGGVDNWTRLGLTLQQKDKWVEYNDDWLLLYPQYSNKATVNATIRADLKDLRLGASRFFRPILDIINANLATTNEDRLVFNIAPKKTAYSHRPKINDLPMSSVNPISNGDFNVTVRESKDSTRASIHPDADGVEVAYIISDLCLHQQMNC